MASFSTNISTGAVFAQVRDGFGRALHGIGAGFEAFLTARSRMHQIERLNAKSDEQLARMGLRREDIARHVFRDILYL
jgi:hypothetical protein